MRGLPASGKSTWITEHNLDPYVICPDSIRLLFASPTVNEQGKFGISQAHDKAVWELVFKLLEERMDRGEFVVVDATHKRISDFTKYQDLANKYFYKMACVDFSDVPLDVCLQRNSNREEYKQVPEDVITKHHDILTKHHVPKSIKRFTPDQYDQYQDFVQGESKPKDLSSYKKLVFVGDIQGCYEPIKSYFNGRDFDDQTAYIFVGDFLDRGIQNDLVIEWAAKNLTHKPNVFVIMGNHERHLVTWLANKESKSQEFTNKTLPQILSSGVSKDQIHSLVRKMRDMLHIVYHGKNIFVSHAGVSTIPQNLHLITSRQYWNNFGNYGMPVDKMFAENHPEWYQVHGHRNLQGLPIQASSNSWNLESRVEFGGFLRIVEMSKDPVSIIINNIEIPNTVYLGYKDRIGDPAFTSIDPSDSPWFVQDPNFTSKMSDNLFKELSDHKLINAKTFDSMPHITSFGFTKKAFYDKAWDAINIKARGLFVNNANKDIVGRSYEKFFNYQENEAHQKSALQKRLAFPIQLIQKENGFLGLVGYDAQTDSLLISSKSNPESEFAQNFQRIFNQTFSQSVQHRIKTLLRDQQASLTFEVIDPIADPHIIAYNKEKLVLLDIVARSEKFIKAPYEEVVKLANQLGVEHKKRFAKFTSWDKFEGWLNNYVANVDLTGAHHTPNEGYVVEDSMGFMFKIKSPYYSWWKHMRSIKDKIARHMETQKPFELDQTKAQDTLISKLVDFMKNQDIETLKSCIINVREEFFKDPANVEFFEKHFEKLQSNP